MQPNNPIDEAVWPLCAANSKPTISRGIMVSNIALRRALPELTQDTIEVSIRRWKDAGCPGYQQPQLGHAAFTPYPNTPVPGPAPGNPYQGRPQERDFAPGLPEVQPAGDRSPAGKPAASDKRIEELEAGEEIPLTPTERMRFNEAKRELQRVSIRQTLWDRIKEDLLSADSKIRPPAIPEGRQLQSRSKYDAEEMCLKISDIHIGLDVDQEEMGGLGNYNLEIFKQRLERLKESLEICFEIHLQNTPCPALNIFLEGDLLDGNDIYPGHERQKELGISAQLIELKNHLVSLFSWLSGLHKWKINIYSVPGNHTRLGKPGQYSPRDCFDYVISHWVKDILSKHENINFNISESWWMIVERMGKRFFLNHGEDVKSWMGIPFYGLQRFEGNVKKMMEVFGVQFDYISCGHFHNIGVIKSLLLNGAWPGGTEYSAKSIQVVSPPQQMLFGLHRDRITWIRAIDLDDAKNNKIMIYK